MDNGSIEQNAVFEKKLAFVTGAIQSKAWYGYNPQTEGFDWGLSVGAISKQLSLGGRENDVRQAFESAFSSACLAQVEVQDKDGTNVKKPMVEAFCDLGLELFVWTVGDKDWQKTKCEKSTANNFIGDNHFFCVPTDKLNLLKEMLDTLKSRPRGKNTHVIVVDDKKEKHTDRVKNEIGPEFSKTDEGEALFTVGEFCLKLDNPLADAQVFYDTVLERRKNEQDEELILILDFDGVIADTDSVLFGDGAKNIAKLL